MSKTLCAPLAVLCLCLSLLLPAPAAAQVAKGVLVRLEAQGQDLEGPLKVRLTPEDGQALELTLADDGKPPDVSAGDGTYAAASEVEADAFDVVLLVGDREIAGGQVSWAADEEAARDLVIRLVDGEINLSAGVPTVAPQAPDGVPTGQPAVGQPGVGQPVPASGAVPSSGAVPASGAVPPVVGEPVADVDGQRDALLWVVVGLALILVAVAGFVLSRWVSGSSRLDLPVVPEPPLLGPATPSLSDGLSVWQAPPDQVAGLLAPLLATLARDHRVLLVAPGGVQAPRVFGGPVYRAPSTSTDDVEDALHHLADAGGAPLTLLLVTDPAAPPDLAAIREALPDSVGGIVLAGGALDTSLPRLDLRTDGGVVVIDSALGSTRVRATDRGFEAT